MEFHIQRRVQFTSMLQKDTGTTHYTGKMEIAPEGNYKDVYKVTLPEGYTKIRFAAYLVNDTNVAANGDATD